MAETGATAAQIEAAGNALDERFHNSPQDRVWGEYGNSDDYGPHCGDDIVQLVAPHLVQPGSRIVGPGGVWLTDEQAATAREALPRVIAFLCGYGHSRPQLASDIAALTEMADVLGGGV